MGLREKLRTPKPRAREQVPAALAAKIGLAEGEVLFVSEGCAADIDNWQASRVVTTFDQRTGKSSNKTNLRNIKARLLVYCLTDAEGAYVCQEEDAEAIGGWGQTVIDPLYEMALRLNGLKKDDDEEEKPDPNASAA